MTIIVCLVVSILTFRSASGEDEGVQDCGIDRVNVLNTGAVNPFSQYVGRPVLVEGLADNWPARRGNWGEEDWHHVFRDVSLPVRPAKDVTQAGVGQSPKIVKGEEYFASLYGEENWLGEEKIVFTAYGHDTIVELLNGTGAIEIPPALSAGNYDSVASIGGLGAGLGWHYHESAWLTLLHGSKRWYFRAPDLTPARRNHAPVRPSSREAGTLTCVQRAGETIYVPSFWWHATKNVESKQAQGKFTLGVGGQSLADGLLRMAQAGDVEGLERVRKAGFTAIQDKMSNAQSFKELVKSAARSGHGDTVKWLLKPKGLLNDDWRRQVLMVAAQSGHVGLMMMLKNDKFLQEDDISTDVTSVINMQPLQPIQYAAQYGHVPAMEWLVAQRADLKVRTRGGRANMKLGEVGGNGLIHLAASKGRDNVIEFLVTQRVNVNEQGQNLQQAVHNAALNGHVSTMALLFQHDVPVSAPAMGFPIHYAAQGGHLATAKWLVERGSRVAIDNQGNMKPRDLAERRGFTALRDWLDKVGAKEEKDASDKQVLKEEADAFFDTMSRTEL